jgi:hypothetical protein
MRYRRRTKKRTVAKVLLVLFILASVGFFAYLVPYWKIVNRPRFPARLAIVKPVFTAAAYKGYPEKSFYGFYRKHSNVSQGTIVKTDLKLLTTTVNKNDWGSSGSVFYFFTLLPADRITIRNYTTILSDIDVNNGKLFAADGSRRFDAVVLGFSEYVTQAEYDNYKGFVETGGKLLFLDANNFLAEVKYNPDRNEITLVKGHGWEFNGTAAWRGIWSRWSAENTNWVGSNFRLHDGRRYRVNGAIANTSHLLSVLMRENFGQLIFTSYRAHEENAITNSSDKVIAYWKIAGLKGNVGTVAVYEHNYRKGTVIHTGIFGSDIMTDIQMQFFLQAAVGVPTCDIVLPPELEMVLLSKYTCSTTANLIQTVAERHYPQLLEALVVVLVGTNIYLLWIIKKRER